MPRPVIHEDWLVRNKCMWREIHPCKEVYEATEEGHGQALEDLETFKNTGEVPRAPRIESGPGDRYWIQYSDLSVNLYNIGEQRSLDVRIPIISESEVYNLTGDMVYWTNHPECVKCTWIEEITRPEMDIEERWFHVEFDLNPLVGDAR